MCTEMFHMLTHGFETGIESDLLIDADALIIQVLARNNAFRRAGGLAVVALECGAPLSRAAPTASAP